MTRIRVTASRSYDVLIQPGLLDRAGEELRAVLPGARTAAVAADETLSTLYGARLAASLEAVGFRTVSFSFPAGEGSKNLTTYAALLDFLGRNGLSRSDVLVALGGGVTGDLAGFAAATYQRGMAFCQVPASLLAAVDSSVGGKTGIDLPQQIFIGEENNLSVNFVNKSRTDIYNLSAKLNCEGLSNNGEEQYLGNLASGTTSSADFYITGNEKCELVGEVIITYEDTNMNQRTVSVPFTTQVTSYEDVWGPSNPSVDPGTDPGTDPGMEEPAGFPWFWVIGGVVVVAAGVFVYLKLRKNKKESVDEDEDI